MTSKKANMELNHAHEIQQLFRYTYKNQWVSQSFINQHTRIWIATFNKLVKQGFIEKKKSVRGNVYRWSSSYPDI